MEYLLCFDFDGTIAQTFQPSPKEIDVWQLYKLAIKDIFGEKGLIVYDKIGGLQNRAPTELVQEMLEQGPTERLIRNAHQFFLANTNDLKNTVPEGKGLSLVWDAHSPGPIMAELLVRQKLFYGLKAVGAKFEDGSVWPRPCQGFLSFWDQFPTLRESGIEIKTAIISSGHEEFIEKTFNAWTLPPPDIIITEDDIRGRKYPQEMKRRVKPGQLPLALAHYQWLKMQKSLPDENGIIRLAKEIRERMLYFGDDKLKDGQMAKGAGIPFGHFNQEQDSIIYPEESIVFGDWTDITCILRANIKSLQEGKPLSKIFCPITTHVENVTSRSPEG